MSVLIIFSGESLLLEMSTGVQFMIFSGEGSVANGPTGVELNGFTHTRKAIDRPTERSFQSIYNWLERGFRVNRDTHFLTVQTLVNRTNEGAMWDLMTISNTAEWKFYIENALQHGWIPAILVRSYPILPSAVLGEDEGTNRVEAAEDEHNVQEVQEQINEEEDNVQEMEENMAPFACSHFIRLISHSTVFFSHNKSAKTSRNQPKCDQQNTPYECRRSWGARSCRSR